MGAERCSPRNIMGKSVFGEGCRSPGATVTARRVLIWSPECLTHKHSRTLKNRSAYRTILWRMATDACGKHADLNLSNAVSCFQLVAECLRAMNRNQPGPFEPQIDETPIRNSRTLTIQGRLKFNFGLQADGATRSSMWLLLSS